MSRLIAVAGFMGAGKSLVTRELASVLHAPIIDGDTLAKEIMLNNSSVIENIDAAFGVVTEGEIDFRTLAHIVFSDKARLEELNAIVHPVLLSEIENLSSQNTLSILDAALVPLWQATLSFDVALWVTTSEEIRLERIMERNGFSKEETLRRIRGQYETLTSPKNEFPWIHFENSGSIEEMTTALQELVRKEISYE